jgi:hypothetical protein
MSVGDAVQQRGRDTEEDRFVISSSPRHQQKYIDVPVLSRRVFVFTRARAPTGQRAATPSGFLRVVRASPMEQLTGPPASW